MKPTISSPSWLIILLLSLASFCLTQDIETNARKAEPSQVSSSQLSSTSSAPAQTHTVQVGLADHKYKPDVMMAAIGDTVEFRFYPTNHSVVRAEYGMPCIPYEMTGSKKSGFFSGFNAVDKVVDNPPKFSIKINDTRPIFFYCSAPGSCITYGMVGVINPTGSTPIANQSTLAKKSAYMLQPGEPFPPEGPVSSSVPGATATSTPVPTISNEKEKCLAPGAIAGIAIGGVGVMVFGALLFFFWGRNKTLQDEVERKESSIARRTDSAAAMIQATSNTGADEWQHYSIQHASPQVQQQSQHGYHNSISSTHSVNNSYLPPPPPPQAQKYASPTLANHPAFSLPSVNNTHKSPINQHISPTTYELPHDSYLVSPTTSIPTIHMPSQPAQIHIPPQSSLLSQSSSTYSYPSTRSVPQQVPPPQYGSHVNATFGPQEMDGASAPARQGSVSGDNKDRERLQVRRARWEEVRREEGGMF